MISSAVILRMPILRTRARFVYPQKGYLKAERSSLRTESPPIRYGDS